MKEYRIDLYGNFNFRWFTRDIDMWYEEISLVKGYSESPGNMTSGVVMVF